MNPTDPNPGNSEPQDASKTSSQSAQSIRPRTSQGRILRRLAIIPLVSIVVLYALSLSASRPSNLGATDGKLAKCPDSPNCVSTQSDDSDHQMPAISFSCEADEMLEKIKRTIQAEFPRANLVSEVDHYLHYEFTSLVFRFVDDVEFFVDDTASLVHFRSASRAGHSDLGANRKRMNKISESLKQ